MKIKQSFQNVKENFAKNKAAYGVATALAMGATDSFAVITPLDPTTAVAATDAAANTGITVGQGVVAGIASLIVVGVVIAIVKKMG